MILLLGLRFEVDLGSRSAKGMLEDQELEEALIHAV